MRTRIKDFEIDSFREYHIRYDINLLNKLVKRDMAGEDVRSEIMVHLGADFHQCRICGQTTRSKYDTEGHRTSEMDKIQVISRSRKTWISKKK